MNTRHRNGPSRGYRSNSMGIGGVAVASRISPEGSARGRHMFNSEQTNRDRGGYRHGARSKLFQPPLPVSNANVFMKAGRLAAEYLVSKGVLPPNAMSENWRGDRLKNLTGEVENRPISAHSLSRIASLDAESSRRYSDEHNSMGTRDSVKRRRRSESLKIYGSDVNRELGKSEGFAGRRYEQSVGKDGIGGLHNLSPGQITNSGSGTVLESEVPKCNSLVDESTNTSSFSDEKSLLSDASVNPAVESGDTNRSTEETKAVKMGRNENVLEQMNGKNKTTDPETGYANVPTDSRSSVTMKGSDNVQDGMNEDANVSQRENSDVSGVHATDVSADHSINNPSYENQNLITLDSDVIESATEDKVPGEQRSGFLSEKSVCMEQKPDEGLTGFDSLSSLLINKGSKRTLDCDNDSMESLKKHREWFPTIDGRFDGSQPLSSSMANQEHITSQTGHVPPSDAQKILNGSVFSKRNANLNELLEEKQLFPGSFKTWDLNLVGTGDVNENNDAANPVLHFSPFAETGKEAVPIDVDLSMSNNRNSSNNKGKHGVNDNDIEVIDLEDEAGQEDKMLDDPKRRRDSVFADMDDFRNVHNNANEDPSVQGGYGLMMSGLFGNGNPNSSSMAAGLNSLHNNMSLPNGEGILGDDESIYMSLGEIPSSLLGPWEHSNQDYEKPFRVLRFS